MSNPLIEPTEMYLRTVWELEEEGIPALRARLTERLGVSAPTVSETVARLEADGLLTLNPDRTLTLTAKGRDIAVSVMRKHRLAERLLVDVIGLEWEHVHTEACRWEHVISDRVEQRLVDLLGAPTTCPHGNPIPGLGEEAHGELGTLADDGLAHGRVRIERLSEQLQGRVEVMRALAEEGLRPGVVVTVERQPSGVHVNLDGGTAELDEDIAALIYVSRV